MKNIIYNPETHVLVPREPSEEMLQAATADSCWENMNPPPSTAYRLMIAAAPQPEQVDSAPRAYYDPQERGFYWAMPTKIDVPITVMVKPIPLYTAPQPDRAAELEAALKVARDTIKYYSIVCGEDDQPTPAKEALAKINEVLKP